MQFFGDMKYYCVFVFFLLAIVRILGYVCRHALLHIKLINDTNDL